MIQYRARGIFKIFGVQIDMKKITFLAKNWIFSNKEPKLGLLQKLHTHFQRSCYIS